MKTTTRKDSFAPICLIIETPFEFDAIMLALRMGADGMREIGRDVASRAGIAVVNDDAPACVDFARSLLENPEVTI